MAGKLTLCERTTIWFQRSSWWMVPVVSLSIWLAFRFRSRLFPAQEGWWHDAEPVFVGLVVGLLAIYVISYWELSLASGLASLEEVVLSERTSRAARDAEEAKRPRSEAAARKQF